MAKIDLFNLSDQTDTPGAIHTQEPLQVLPPQPSEAPRPIELSPPSSSDVVYSAAHSEMPASELGSSVTVITSEELKNRRIQNVAEALQNVPGLDVVTIGGPGQTSLVSIRGASAQFTLVMLNGLELNDPMSIGQVADLANLTVDNVERIEIVRGPQSAVYGSGGLAGVINIITRKAAGKAEGSLGLSGGKYATWVAKASGSGVQTPWDLAFGTSWDQTQGYSAARQMTYAEPQPDMLPNAYRNFTADADLGYQALDNLGLRLAGRWAKGRVQLDKGYGDSWDAENYWTDFARFQSRLEANLDLWKKLWRQQFSLALSQNERVSTNDSKMPGYPLPSRYLGRHLAVEWKHQFRDLVAGAVYSQEQGTYHDENYFPFMNPDLPEHSSHQVGLYLENRFHWEALVMDAGIRWDIHDQYGSQTTYRLTPVYLLAATNTRFKGSYGIGFKAPSLDQLYADYGNTSLKPETSTGWEAGLEQGFWLKQMTMGLTYFQTDFENQISYDFASAKDRNLGRVQTKGWEAFAAWQMVSPLNLKLSYTKLTANDLTHADIVGPQTLPNGSDYKMILSADYHWEALHGSIQIARVGPHYDMTEGFQPRPLLAPYTEVDLTAAWAFTPELQVYAKINNLLDADYIEVVGYNTPRFAAYGGIEVKLP